MAEKKHEVSRWGKRGHWERQEKMMLTTIMEKNLIRHCNFFLFSQTTAQHAKNTDMKVFQICSKFKLWQLLLVGIHL